MSEAQKTVRVRIAVAVADDGPWSACGGDYYSEDLARNDAMDNISDQGRRAFYWIEADVPLPTSAMIEGEVKA